MSADEHLERAEELLRRLEKARDELEQLAADEPDAERAVEVLQELAELAKQVEVELARARRDAGAEA
ncbi:MAG TPA: hypothetical protein VGQ15_09335 [Gaiellaceae bacterium]|jgi:CHASE3 domain sensor protein|nr:hypothetical protein [Gaiellaceae bacterium]